MRPILFATAALLLAGAGPAATVSGPIAVNLLGFEPGDRKIAVLAAGGAAMPWTLVDVGGRIVARGMTIPYGDDPASGMKVQRLDFSGFDTPGKGYRLIAESHASDPFDIGTGLFVPLARDAAAFFYHQRAGIPIEARIVGAQWARPAGHPHEVAKCFAGNDERGKLWPGCGYSLDVTGGWYDAGDHGKYVVNGGIALWTLLNAYERRPRAFADKSLRIPEAGNGVSDLLDEARYEMEFLLRMQVPEGELAGMAHQKVADRNWTTLPTPPHQDSQERLLYPPTTAATLNLAATAAQCGRLWRGVDDAFAARCLAAAKRAWQAALRHPAVYASNSFTGSGGYGDGDVSDEFYWAAAELLRTTGDPEYRTAVTASPHFQKALSEPGWPNTATLAAITLATGPAILPAADVQRLRGALIAAADRFLEDAKGNGYGVPLLRYTWGSNSSVLNRAMLLGLAHDFTGAAKYRAGVVAAMDYILGRNPMNVSYVSGYGTRSMQNPHHRFWAHSLDARLPGPPPGVLSGGPNSVAMADDVAKKMKGKCAPQTCWADDVHAYALNEVAVNWNAPLFWVAAWLDS